MSSKDQPSCFAVSGFSWRPGDPLGERDEEPKNHAFLVQKWITMVTVTPLKPTPRRGKKEKNLSSQWALKISETVFEVSFPPPLCLRRDNLNLHLGKHNDSRAPGRKLENYHQWLTTDPSVRPSLHPVTHPSVHPSISPSIHPSIICAWVYVCVGVCVHLESVIHIHVHTRIRHVKPQLKRKHKHKNIYYDTKDILHLE
jgi:hypothetical protein